MAEWSGPAKMAFKQLEDLLAQKHIGSENVICIDVDREPWIYDLPEFAGKIHGNGEAAVVKDGRVVFETSLGADKTQIQERCEELLRFYESEPNANGVA